MSINSFDELPDHIIAAMSHAERNYHRALLLTRPLNRLFAV